MRPNTRPLATEPAAALGRGLRRLRKSRRLGRDEMAARLGLSATDLSRMERGECRVSLDTLCRVIAEFGEGLTDLMNEARQLDALSNDARQALRLGVRDE